MPAWRLVPWRPRESEGESQLPVSTTTTLLCASGAPGGHAATKRGDGDSIAVDKEEAAPDVDVAIVGPEARKSSASFAAVCAEVVASAAATGGHGDGTAGGSGSRSRSSALKLA
mmetsp:Transcript_149948/g.481845  ORF Transcript_149948/g.481845 Transcript_149948/m.481845 type:complete len:114 (+) Transcript_149948:364-705(+)